jgi:thiamine biosynthesis lipoprotein
VGDAFTGRILVPHIISGGAPDAGAALVRLQGRSMGCGWTVTCVAGSGVDTRALATGVEAALARVVDQMSTWEPDSAITRFNRAAAGSWLPLPQEFALVLACALHVAGASDGALDPTSGALVSTWGFGPTGRYLQPGFALPAADLVEAARQRGGWQRLRVDLTAMRIHQPGGIALDLSAVAKGFAVDEVSRFLRSAGVVHHLVDIGGELRGAGMKPDGQPWWVDVQQPPDSGGITPTRIALHGLSVATSGDYQQGFSVNGRRYSHCIDPRSGYPVDNGVCRVTVLHPDCMLADAWSTALMVLGVPAGLAMAESQHIAAQWLVRSDGGVTEHHSSVLRALIT